MGKLIISTGPFSRAMSNYQRVVRRCNRIPNKTCRLLKQQDGCNLWTCGFANMSNEQWWKWGQDSRDHIANPIAPDPQLVVLSWFSDLKIDILLGDSLYLCRTNPRCPSSQWQRNQPSYNSPSFTQQTFPSTIQLLRFKPNSILPWPNSMPNLAENSSIHQQNLYPNVHACYLF